jgi:uncharacterized repeat protein (TIGR01451 family)
MPFDKQTLTLRKRKKFFMQTILCRRHFWHKLSLFVLAILCFNILAGAFAPVASAAALSGTLSSGGNTSSTSQNVTLPTPPTRTGTPFQDPQLPSLSLNMTFNTQQAIVGDVVTATVTVSNYSLYTANNLTVSLPTPAGTSALPGTPGFVSASAGWQWSQASLKGGTKQNSNVQTSGDTATFTAAFQINSLPTGEAVLAKLQASAAGLSAPVQFSSGVIVEGASTPQARAAGASSKFNPSTDTTLNSNNKHLTVKVPAGASATNLTLTQSPGWR